MQMFRLNTALIISTMLQQYYHSFTEDVTPEELSKILSTFEPKLASLERKIGTGGEVGNTTVKGRKAAAAVRGTFVCLC